MADDTELSIGGGGDKIRDLDKSPGVKGKTQIVVIDMGGGGAEDITSIPATQATLAAVLAELLLKARVTDTQPVSTTSLPLPAGAATEAGNLATIAGKDFATSAKQDAGNTSLASIDGKLTNPLPVNGTVTANQGTSAVTANAWPTKVTDGSNVQAVKAASTAALASDSSSVVALSPNTPLPSGTNLLGKVGIDQTTPGTTNLVSIGTDGVVQIKASATDIAPVNTEGVVSGLSQDLRGNLRMRSDGLEQKLDQLIAAICVGNDLARANLAAADPSQFVPFEVQDFLGA